MKTRSIRIGFALALVITAAVPAASCVDWIDISPRSESQGTGGGGGTSGGCEPGVIVACYDGPSGTEGKGICKAGSKTCAADGQSFGPCTGAITPRMESCAMQLDQDCDGLLPSCKGSPVWSRSFGGGSHQYGRSVAVDSAGNALVTGSFMSTLEFGNGPPLVSQIYREGFVAKLSASGNALWSKSFEGYDQFSTGVAVDSAGNVLVTGAFWESADFGDGPLVALGNFSDGFIVKLDASGKTLWSKRFGDADAQAGQHVAVDSAGNVIVTGVFVGSADFGDGLVLSNGGQSGFVVKLDPSGKVIWGKSFGNYLYEATVAVDSAGNVLLVGAFDDPIDFGNGSFNTAGGKDVFVAKLDADGKPLWSKRFGDAAGDQYGASVAVDSAGNVLVVGVYTSSIDFGSGPLLTSSGEKDGFVAKLDANGGALWSVGFNGKEGMSCRGVAADSAGNVLITGNFSGATSFGDGLLGSTGKGGAFLAKLDSDGNYVWSKGFGDVGGQDPRGIAVNGVGEAFITGGFTSPIDFGDGPLVSAGYDDVFVAKFSP